MRHGLQRKSYLEDLDCLGTVLLVKVGGLRDLRIADGLVDAENRKGSCMTTEILEAGSTGARTREHEHEHARKWRQTRYSERC